MSPRQTVARRIRGLYALTDPSVHEDPVELGHRVLEGGGRLLQLRCKGWAPDEVIRAARELRPACLAVGATLIVNDDPEIAVAADADGVHVGQTDASADQVRAVIGPDRILGRSTNDPAQVPAALASADYVAFGPTWPTDHLSRPKAVQGVTRLAEVRRMVPVGVPLVAIGGITAERLPVIRDAGADAWAVIGALAGDIAAETRRLL